MVDVNVKVPALEKLLDYAASGIGAVAGSMLAPWRARQDAKAKLIGAQANVDSLRLIADAQADALRSLIASDETGGGVLEIGTDGITQRIEFQEKKRQANIASVVRDAAADLGDKEVPDHDPDPDWTARFFDCVQDISSEDMKRIWAKLLSGEVESPGRTSLRTLEVLRNMAREEARMFSDICELVVGRNPHVVFYEGIQESNKYNALDHDRLVRLGECGLVNFGGLGGHTFVLEERYIEFDHEDFILQVSSNKGNTSRLSLTVATLTAAGVELYRISEARVNMDYLKSCAGMFQRWGYRLSRAELTVRHSGGSIEPRSEFVPIEPEPEHPQAAAS